MSGKLKRLNESERLKVIPKFNQPNPHSKRSIAPQYGVSEAFREREDIRKRSSLISKEAKKKTFRASVGRFTEIEDKLFQWIGTIR